MSFISIVGLPRSGTTTLARALACAEGVKYFEEPNPVWRYKNWKNLGHDQFEAEHATPWVSKYIRGRLQLNHSASRLIIEKTPSNSLRIPFVEAVAPEVKFVFVRRNTDDIKSSISRKWLHREDSNADWLGEVKMNRDFRTKFGKLKFIPISEFHLHFWFELQAGMQKKTLGRTRYWGPEIPNWEVLSSESPTDVVDAVVSQMENRLNEGILKCKSRHVEIEFEKITSDLDSTIREISQKFDEPKLLSRVKKARSGG
ncbi:MAG: sulfotransferase [Pelagimonas sp.]|jgi:hypothetical protein|nr:sulfotransferase [Pelagimonas sp.]